MRKLAFGMSFALMALPMLRCNAQNIFFNALDGAPIFINPSFTGEFNGAIRITGMYVNSYQEEIPFVAYTAGADASIHTFHNGDYLGAGIQVMNSVAGDGDIRNYYAVGSVAYHKALAIFSKKRNTDIALGGQFGYMSSFMDLSRDYFNSNRFPPYFNNGIGLYPVTLGNAQTYTPFNAGISIAQSLTPHISYIAGYSMYNLNGSNNYYVNINNELTGSDVHSALTLGLNWQFAQRLTLRPALYYQFRESENDMIAGGELNILLAQKRTGSKSVFIGGYYHTGDMRAYTAGADLTVLRLSICWDAPSSSENKASTGGFEFMARYILPAKHSAAAKRTVPCNRF